MLVFSLNLKGVGGAPKTLALRRLFTTNQPNVIFLQETMSLGSKACAFLWSFFPDWGCYTIDSIGLSGGLLAAWNPWLLSLSSFLVCGGILLLGRHKDLSVPIYLCKCYAPCLDRHIFGRHWRLLGLWI